MGSVLLVGPVGLLFLVWALTVLGLFHRFDRIAVYRMEPADPITFLKTVGPITLLLLVVGVLAYLRRELRPFETAQVLPLGLLVFLILVGVFQQQWYRSSFVAVPAHRYYIFYSLVALTWVGLLGSRMSPEVQSAFRSRRRCLVVAVVVLAPGGLCSPTAAN